MKNQKQTELSKKKKVYMQNFLAWLLEQPENIVYNITNKLGEFKMKQKKTKDITLELIYKELTGFITKQEDFNDKVILRLDNIEKDITVLKTDVAAIKSCPTIKRELELL